MKNIKRFIVCFWLLLFAMACEIDGDNAGAKQYSVNFKGARTNAELEKLRLNPNNNLIRTSVDFDHIARKYNTPLSLLSHRELNEFASKIVFREGVGVVGLNYSVLEENLTYEQVADVLLLFGLDSSDGFWGLNSGAGRNFDAPENEDYKGYECIGKGTCFENSKAICLSGC